MTITTPEQMREAAIVKLQYLQDVSGRNQDGDFYVGEEAACFAASVIDDAVNAIRAIPIAPQPVAVTVKPLKGIDQQVMAAAALISEKAKENPEWAFIDYEANAMSFGRWAKCGPNPAPYIRADIVHAALTIYPADPLSDPRVVALVEALKTTRDKLASMAHDQFDGVWSASDFEDETRDADAALRAIGGEA